MNPVVNKSSFQAIVQKLEDTQGGSPKAASSSFDQVRARLQEENAQKLQMPPEVNSVSEEQKKVLAADLRKRIESARGTPPKELFKKDLQTTKTSLDKLAYRVNALPQTGAFDPLRERLTRIEAQFADTGKLADSLTNISNPGQMMKVQMQVYQMSQNLEMMSKVVEQVNSGVKSILQTQL